MSLLNEVPNVPFFLYAKIIWRALRVLCDKTKAPLRPLGAKNFGLPYMPYVPYLCDLQS